MNTWSKQKYELSGYKFINLLVIQSTCLSKCPKDLTTRCYLMTQARLCWGWDQQVTETKPRIFSSVGISSGKPPASREMDAALKTKWAPAEATASSVSTREDLTLLVTQSCPTLWPTDCSLPGSSVHGILQERILEWVVIRFSKRCS